MGRQAVVRHILQNAGVELCKVKGPGETRFAGALVGEGAVRACRRTGWRTGAWSPKRCPHGSYDVLRYTMCIEPSVYVSKATEVLKGLEAQGYTVVKFKNKWDGDLYRGLNTQIKIPDGIMFEVQFHTPESHEVYDKAHAYYEIARAENSTKEQVEEANRKRRELYEGLEVPEGALEFTWE